MQTERLCRIRAILYRLVAIHFGCRQNHNKTVQNYQSGMSPLVYVFYTEIYKDYKLSCTDYHLKQYWKFCAGLSLLLQVNNS